MHYSCIKTADHITVVNSETGESGTVNADHKNYETALEAVRNGDYDAFMFIANPAPSITKLGEGRIVITDGVVIFDEEELHGVLADKMVDSIQDGFGIEPLAAFLINLNENPSKRAIDELYGFLEASDLTITVDGHFVAYKKVREDYTDCHSGKFDNSPGSVVEMERNKVDDNKDRTCSSGLHFCGREYLKSFGGARTVIVKINPRDVVSIPADYDNHKGRCCKYEVIGELDNGRDEGLEGSVFTGKGLDIHDEIDTVSDNAWADDDSANKLPDHGCKPGLIHNFYPTRGAARTDARNNSHQIYFKDFGVLDSAVGERWATLYK